MTPTPTTFFEGQNLIGGLLSTGQTIFASFKPILVLIISVLGGFFVISVLIIIIRGVVMKKLEENNYLNEVVQQQIMVHYKHDVETLMQQNYTSGEAPETLAQKIKDLTNNYRLFIKKLKSK